GGAGGQAEPAVDAVGHQLGGRRPVAVERRLAAGRRGAGERCVVAGTAGPDRCRSPALVRMCLVWMSHLDASDETARSETTLGVEAAVDGAPEIQAPDRAR